MGRALADPRKGCPSGPGPGRTPFSEPSLSKPFKNMLQMAFWGIHMGRPLGSPMARPRSISFVRVIFFVRTKNRLIYIYVA